MKKKLTKWEVGNELIKANDCLGDVIRELKDYPEIQVEVRLIKNEIVELYNKHEFVKEMGFGI